MHRRMKQNDWSSFWAARTPGPSCRRTCHWLITDWTAYTSLDSIHSPSSSLSVSDPAFSPDYVSKKDSATGLPTTVLADLAVFFSHASVHMDFQRGGLCRFTMPIIGFAPAMTALGAVAANVFVGTTVQDVKAEQNRPGGLSKP